MLKRKIDLLISAALLYFTLPFIVIISIMIKLESRGPVFFKQKRIGKDGEEFKMYKFRTMINNAEKTGSGVFTGSQDPRITKVGYLLRKTSLDELPQLINIIKGDMSFIGPRPPVTYHPYKYEEYSNDQKKRFDMLPGVTGLAQVSGRNILSWDERIEIDVEYVNKHSLFLDVKIVILTVLKILTRDGVYSKKDAK